MNYTLDGVPYYLLMKKKFGANKQNSIELRDRDFQHYCMASTIVDVILYNDEVAILESKPGLMQSLIDFKLIQPPHRTVISWEKTFPVCRLNYVYEAGWRKDISSDD